MCVDPCNECWKAVSWNYGRPWRLSPFAVLLFSFCFLFATVVSSRSDNNGCSSVKNIWKSKGFGESQQVPSSPIQADHLSVCGTSTGGGQGAAWSTCCTRQMEAKLTTHSRQQFNGLLSDKLNSVRTGFQTRASAFEEFCTELVDKSGRELHNMFTRTYGIIYQQNSHVFSELFRDLRAYLRGDDHDLSDVLDAFFSSLLLRMFTLLNGQYVFDERYLGCISERSQELTPFGDVPHKLGLQVKRAFVAARTFRHGVVVASDVINSLSKMELSTSCQKAITRMLYCPYCRGVTSGVRPCSGLCLNVVRGCLAHQPDFSTAWSGFVESMLKVADRLDGPFSIENVLEPMDVKISEAIMNFQENAEAVTSKVFQVCGQPNLGVRSKRNAETGKKRKGTRSTTVAPSTTTSVGGQGSAIEDPVGRTSAGGRKQGHNRSTTVATTQSVAVAANMSGESYRGQLVLSDNVTDSSLSRLIDSTVTNATSLTGNVRQIGSGVTLPLVTQGRVDRGRSTSSASTTPLSSTTTSTTIATTRLTTTTTTAATTTTTTARRTVPVTTTMSPRRSVRTTTKMPVVAGRRKGGSRGAARTPAAAVPISDRDVGRSSAGRGGGVETMHTAFEKMMSEIRSTLTDSHGFLAAVPERMCAGVAATQNEESRCWNGTSRSRYTAVVVDMATESQQNNREVLFDGRRSSSVINQAVFQLKQITDKLKRAYNGDSVDWSDDGESDDEDLGSDGDDEDGYDDDGSGSGHGDTETRRGRNRFEGSGSMGTPPRKPQPPYHGVRNIDDRYPDTISRQHHGYSYNIPSTRRPPPIFVVPTTSPKRVVYVTTRPKATQRLYVPSSSAPVLTSINHLVPFVVGIFGFVNVTMRLCYW